MTPMLLCAHDITLKVLANAGHKLSLVGGDPLARWASAAFRFVDDPGMRRPPPTEFIRISERVERGEATAQERLVVDACALPLLVWTRVDDAHNSTPDPEGDGSPEEHDADRARRAAAWENTGKAKVLPAIEAALAELVPALVERLLVAR